jgi:uncharacterized membrane protein
VVYTIYDMTNYSLVRDWLLRVALIDIGWGGVGIGIGVESGEAASVKSPIVRSALSTPIAIPIPTPMLAGF